jgi:hypothetical protein
MHQIIYVPIVLVKNLALAKNTCLKLLIFKAADFLLRVGHQNDLFLE